MTLSRRAKVRLMVAGSMVAPILAAQAMRLLGLGGLATSAASVASAVPPPDLSAAFVRHPDPTPEQTRALQWLLLHSHDRPVRCPMEQPTAPPPPPVPIDPVPDIKPPVRGGADPLTVLTVTGIMSSEDRAQATINRKFYLLGGSPLPGWKITAIDGENGFVELTGPEGRQVKLHIKRPDPSR